jgi:hypothetical protein
LEILERAFQKRKSKQEASGEVGSHTEGGFHVGEGGGVVGRGEEDDSGGGPAQQEGEEGGGEEEEEEDSEAHHQVLYAS